MAPSDISRLNRRLGSPFPEHELERLRLAVTHRSFGRDNYERLEYLGDAVLEFVMSDWLYHRFPDAKEDVLTLLRARLVRRQTLAEVARELGVGEFLRLGVNEIRSGVQERDTVLADAMEAVMGAVYLAGGMEHARSHVLAWYDMRLQALSVDDVDKDAKSRLQEWQQARGRELPVYTVAAVEGGPGEQMFVVHCVVQGLAEAVVGRGLSRRKAEQQAAAAALQRLAAGECG